jgi:hypothetical protein
LGTWTELCYSFYTLPKLKFGTIQREKEKNKLISETSEASM